jgi:hypothetical protein
MKCTCAIVAREERKLSDFCFLVCLFLPQLSHTASHQAARLRELEAELHQLKAKYGLADGSGSSGDAASAGGEATEAKSGDPTSANGALSSSSSSGPLAPVDEADSDEAPPSADERAAIEALKKRLQKDVDANVDVRPEEPEDPSTL